MSQNPLVEVFLLILKNIALKERADSYSSIHSKFLGREIVCKEKVFQKENVGIVDIIMQARSSYCLNIG